MEIPRAPWVTRQVERASLALGDSELGFSHFASRNKAIEPGLPRLEGAACEPRKMERENSKRRTLSVSGMIGTMVLWMRSLES